MMQRAIIFLSRSSSAKLGPIRKKRGSNRAFKTFDEARTLLGSGRGPGLLLGALGDTGRLAATVAQVVELGTTDGATAHDLDRLDVRGVDREHALDAFAVGDLADREALLEAAAGPGDADAFIGLHAGALAFLDLHVDDDGVAGLKIGNRLAELGDLFLLELLNDVHGQYSCRCVALSDLKTRGISASCCDLDGGLYPNSRPLSSGVWRFAPFGLRHSGRR